MTTATRSQAQYVIGIDLGTSNIVVAYAKFAPAAGEQTQPEFKVWPIPQWLDNGQWGNSLTLPALRYHPGAEISDQQLQLPWQPSPLQTKLPRALFGHWAQQLGVATPGRLVQSAKSWLCQPAEQVQLPWQVAKQVETISPIRAVASYLDYLRCAWLYCFPDAPLEQQLIQLTVPASFDDHARALTQQAAELAGFKKPQLLEEPLAACYDWLQRTPDSHTLNNCKQLLVCDIGGGTSDFTLINIEFDEEQNSSSPDSSAHDSSAHDRPTQDSLTRSNLTLSRIAVGEHLMLGGDNIDLALAVQAQRKLNSESTNQSNTSQPDTGQPNTSALNLKQLNLKQPNLKQIRQLTQQCRLAKEQLLAADAPEEVSINIVGSGSALIGGTQQTRLTRKEVGQLALDGFFPVVAATAYPKQRSSALLQTGLPYPADAAISRHLAAFLAPYAEKTGHYPDALLLNGSPFHSQQLTQRLTEQLTHWQSGPLTLLDNPEPGLAVARGAAYFGWLKHHEQPLIRSDAAHSYFAIVDSPSGKQAFCILPKGSVTDQPCVLETPVFDLKCGQAVQFDVASDGRPQGYQLGQSIADSQQLHHLPALTTQLSGDGTVKVRLTTRLTELGQLEIICQSLEDQQQWPLSFNLRDHERSTDKKTSETETGKVSPMSAQANTLQSKVSSANTCIRQVFGTQTPALDPGKLRQTLEKQCGKREQWSASTARALADTLITGAGKRRRSQKHERIWFNLTGFTLRPGAGMPGDVERIKQLWQLYKHNLQYPQEAPNWIEWWILWRRLAAGLDEQQQKKILHDIRMVLATGYARSAGKKPRNQAGIEERIRLIGALENIPIDNKQKLGEQLLVRIKKGENPVASAWALARVGARQLAYATPDKRVPATQIEPWLNTLLTLDWKQQPALCFPAAALARSTDQTYLIDDALRQQVIEKLGTTSNKQRWTNWLKNETESVENQNQVWGDSLPSGLSLTE